MRKAFLFLVLLVLMTALLPTAGADTAGLVLTNE